MTQNTQDQIKEVCDSIKELLLQKNAKYGDSALNPERVFSKADAVEQIKVRIDDKLSRIATTGFSAIDEDTLQDLIGYLVLLKIALGRQEEPMKRNPNPYAVQHEDVLTYYGQTVDEKEAWPESERLRIYELARELGVTNKVILDAVDELGIERKCHAPYLTGWQVEKVRAFLDKQVPFEATEDDWADWADFWAEASSLGDDVLWDPSVGPVELSEKEVADILAKKALDQFEDAEIVATVEKRGFILGIKKDGSTCELGGNGQCV